MVPPPRRGATAMSPPILRASCLTEDRPSPAPPKREAIETLACENGRNRRLISANFRPMPLSETAKVTPTRPFPCLHARLDTRLGGLLWRGDKGHARRLSVNFTALSIRFSSAARRRMGSPITSDGSAAEMSTSACRPFAAARAGQRIARVARQRPQVEQILAQSARRIPIRLRSCAFWRHRRTGWQGSPDARRPP